MRHILFAERALSMSSFPRTHVYEVTHTNTNAERHILTWKEPYIWAGSLNLMWMRWRTRTQMQRDLYRTYAWVHVCVSSWLYTDVYEVTHTNTDAETNLHRIETRLKYFLFEACGCWHTWTRLQYRESMFICILGELVCVSTPTCLE